MRMIALIIFALSTASMLRAAPPATAPDGQIARVNGRLARTTASCRWSDLIRFEIKAGKLRVDAAPSAEVRKMLSGRPVLMQIEQSPDPWLVTAQQFPGSANRPPGWNFSAAAQPVPGSDFDDFRPLVITSLPDHFHVIGEGRIDGRKMRAEFYLIRDQVLQLTIVDRTAANRRSVVVQEADLGALLAKHPLEVRRYVSPLLDAIAGRRVLKPGDADVYRAFDSIQPDSRSMEQARAIVAELAAPDAARREAASGKLEQLGAPAVLAVLRMDRGDFSPEQRSRIDRFLAAHTIGIDVEKARRDPIFLADCLCDDDRNVRATAKEALSALVGKPIDFDIDQDAPARLSAASQLFEQFSQPTARPE